MAEFRMPPVEVWGQKFPNNHPASEIAGAIASTATHILWTPYIGYKIRLLRIYISTSSAGTINFWFNSASVSSDLSTQIPDFIMYTAANTTEDIVVDLTGATDEILHYSCPNNTFILVHGHEEN
jgi:hypothetical protein